MLLSLNVCLILCLNKNRLLISVVYFYLAVGMIRFERTTTRPPDVYSNRAELHPERFELQSYEKNINWQNLVFS